MNRKRRELSQALLAAPLLAAAALPSSAQQRTKLRNLPRVGLGTWRQLDHPRGAPELLEANEALLGFLEAGGRVIDTSPMYGQAEARLGEVLAGAKRSSAYVATKIWTRGAAAGAAQLARSRELIGRPLDLVQVHNLLDLDAHLHTLRAAREQEQIGGIGVTHYTQSAHAELERVVRRERPDALQINYSLAEPQAGERLLRVAQELDVAVLINRPFAEGAMFAQVRERELPPVAAELACVSWAQLFLKWILADPAVTCVLTGTSKLRHIQDNLAAASGPLPDAKQRDLIRRSWAGG